MKIRPVIVMLALVLTAGTALGQGAGWEVKPFQDWNKEDVDKLLTDSPWAKTTSRSPPMINYGGTPIFVPTLAFTVRLRSALPIRYGLLRLRQINEEYDKMPSQKQTEFDQSNRPLIDCPACAGNYVISIVPASGPKSGGLPTALTKATLEKLKLNVQLTNETGEHREVVHVAPTKTPGSEVMLFFPRLNAKGEPLITPSTKKVILKIATAMLDGDASASRFEFDVAKITVKGQVIF